MKKIFIICLALAIGALFTGPTATPQKLAETINCSYDAAWEEIDYELLGGDDAQEYEVVCTAVGSIEFEEACPNLTGPTDSKDVDIDCTGEGRGTVTLVFKKNGVELHRCTFCFNNDEDENIKQVNCYAGPTMTEWGLLVFAGLFILTLIYVLRRRKGAILRSSA